ncbi:Dyp-type peroxidase domain-containing protein [Oerskovia sp. M15]
MAGVGLAGAGLAGGFLAGSTTASARTAASSPDPADGGGAFAFTGEHQAGITTPVQDSLHFATWDVITQDREEVVALLRAWTLAASRMTQGFPPGSSGPCPVRTTPRRTTRVRPRGCPRPA